MDHAAAYKLIASHMDKKFSTFYRNITFITELTTARKWNLLSYGEQNLIASRPDCSDLFQHCRAIYVTTHIIL
jgi:hypothetical protein